MNGRFFFELLNPFVHGSITTIFVRKTNGQNDNDVGIVVVFISRKSERTFSQSEIEDVSGFSKMALMSI